MANRSYLYACNHIPGERDVPEQNLIGLSECNYAIPLVYKILLCGSPRSSRSRIWNTEDEIAIVGEFEAGLHRLTEFLKKIEIEEAQLDIRNTIQFLNKPENKATYFLLECGEIFDMTDDNLAEQNTLLLDEIMSPYNSMALALANINPALLQAEKKRIQFFKRKHNRAKALPEALSAVAQLGLNNWSNALYFDFS